MNKFGGRFKYSKVLNVIDNIDDAITSNITRVIIRRKTVKIICWGTLILSQILNLSTLQGALARWEHKGILKRPYVLQDTTIFPQNVRKLLLIMSRLTISLRKEIQTLPPSQKRRNQAEFFINETNFQTTRGQHLESESKNT